MSAEILIVDDLPSIRQTLAMALRAEGYRVAQAASGAEALQHLEQTAFDLVVTDLQMPGFTGMDICEDAGIQLLKEVKRRAPDAEVIILTGHASIDSAVEAMKLGAYDYVEKDVLGTSKKLWLKVSQALERRREKIEVKLLRERLLQQSDAQSIVGQARIIEDLRVRIRKIAPTSTTVLVTGETGTGKELVAQEIHRLSARADKPFVPVNCSALPSDLFESELFGHVKGAFTDAASARRGLFEEANGGSFFMDEIGDMPEPLQAKLLRVLEERTIRRMGDNSPIPVDVRIIAATNQNLTELVERGEFRKDLYYRLNVVAIHLPALRERPEDIPLLARHFLTQLTANGSSRVTGFTPEAMRVLQQYDFPGNVRELRNAVEGALAVAMGELIDVVDLPPTLTERNTPAPVASSFSIADSPQPPLDASSPLAVPNTTSIAQAEEVLIRQAVVEHKGNLDEAARKLGISRTTLWRRMKHYKIGRAGGVES
jgi:two-component system response regulator HydG